MPIRGFTVSPIPLVLVPVGPDGSGPPGMIPLADQRTSRQDGRDLRQHHDAVRHHALERSEIKVACARPGDLPASAAALRQGAVCSMVPSAPVTRPGARSAAAFAGDGNPGLSAAYRRQRPPWSGKGFRPRRHAVSSPAPRIARAPGRPMRGRKRRSVSPRPRSFLEPRPPIPRTHARQPVRSDRTRGPSSPLRRMTCRVASFAAPPATFRHGRGSGSCPPPSPCSVARRRPPPPGQRRPAGRAIGVPD